MIQNLAIRSRRNVGGERWHSISELHIDIMEALESGLYSAKETIAKDFDIPMQWVFDVAKDLEDSEIWES